MNPADESPPPTVPQFGRRALLGAAAFGVAGIAAMRALRPPAPTAPVFVARNQRYDGPLATTVADGFAAVGLLPENFRGKRVLLKPNLVEPTREAPHLTTDPRLVVAVAEVFLRAGAVVAVGEGPGHMRDTCEALEVSGLGDALRTLGVPFADLNYEATAVVPNRGRASKLPEFRLPRSVVEADLLVSLPKLKTHHWVGVTCAMKNLYGIIPGSIYGWPKNVLHRHGIPETVFDVNASAPRTATVVDAIDCMEGDGPLMGEKKAMGLVLVGANLPAVDATACRLMDLRPEQIPYLALAADRLGPLADERITQRGEAWRPLASPFRLVEAEHLAPLVAHRAE